MYCKYQNKGTINQTQQDYLLCRALFIETVVFMVLYSLSLILFKEVVNFSWYFFGTLIVIAIITNIATHQKMNRFVNTVIAVDIANEENIE